MLCLSAVLVAGTVCAAAPATAVSAKAAPAKPESMQTASVKAVPANTKLQKKVSAIVSKQVKKKDSKKTKLKKLFAYTTRKYAFQNVVMSGYFEKWDEEPAYEGWEQDFALEMYSKKRGSCFHYAAAYAFLAKEATGCPVRIGLGKTKAFSGEKQDHAWVEVKIKKTWYVCDPTMESSLAKKAGDHFLKKRGSSKTRKLYLNYGSAAYVQATLQ